MLRKAWALAIETLSWMELEQLDERLAFSRTTKQLGIQDSNAVGLAYKMVCETIRRKNFIDHVVNSALAPRSLEDFKLGVQAFLRLYVHQLKFQQSSFENAVEIVRMGRSILGWRELQEVEGILGELFSLSVNSTLEGLSDEEKVGLLTYHPMWFVKYCFHLLGRSEALRFLESNIGVLPTYIRVNTLKAPTKVLLERIENDGIKLEKVRGLQHSYKVKTTKHLLTQTLSFRQGLFYVQDKASCFAVEVADPKPDTTVLNGCASHGAKTTYTAQLMKNRGVIYSIDYSKHKIKMLKREIKRMNVKIAEPVLADARKPLPVHVAADLVVLEPPCTNTGIFSKKPSVKWELTEESIRGMSKVQWDMLNQCAEHVKKGGLLVYSTRSITVEENEMLIERFMKWHPEFKLIKAAPKLGHPGLRGQTYCRRLYPHIHECNGFFVAKLLKEA
ncbi:MAG: RsmB/NOP family class I SAM-dependent RNA methyltransferase [Thermoproteota archaeon]|nr:RsmB/NOP family class I SAM-dependent RNA methyltransferase [Thermoproteota archaeon]